MSTPWSIRNADDLEIIGDTHTPSEAAPTACALILHGFKGYKDYGFIPPMARELARRNILAHRFNFATSGMTSDLSAFARPDLFAKGTWGGQVEDVRRVARAIREGEIAGKGLPLFLLGHSRGGATALLAAGLHADELGLAGLITLNAVDRCCSMSDEQQREMLALGYAVTTSARTGQELRINADWLREQLDHPQAHDVLLQAAHVKCPVCVLHGDSDDAVPIEAGESIAKAAKTALNRVEGADHVLNMPNPSSPETPLSVQLLKALDLTTRFISKQASAAGG